MTRERLLKDVGRIVVKVGTSTLTYGTGKLNLERIEKLVRQLVDLKNSGREVVLVSSGAIGAGLDILGYDHRPRDIPTQQAAAAVGQGILMQIYSRLFHQYRCDVAQILLTREVVVNRRSYLNACNTFSRLLDAAIVPIVNENDTVAVDEIRFGDNDTLSALVAGMIDAQLLIILSDVEGLYTADPARESDVDLIGEVREITPQIAGLAGETGSQLGTGGMQTKLSAARIATGSGVGMIIANGSREGVLKDIIGGRELGTYFLPRRDNLSKRKQWIAFHLKPEGQIIVDRGAEEAIKTGGKSLLPRGITSTAGTFYRDDPVALCTEDRKEFARGLVNYSSEEIERIRGRHSSQIERLLDESRGDEVVHRDNLVLLHGNENGVRNGGREAHGREEE